MESFITIACVLGDAASAVSSFHQEVRAAVDGIGRPVDILYIDNGSCDGTTAKLREIARDDQRVRVLRLSSRCSQQGAVTAALVHAPGQAVVVLESINAPLSMIAPLLERWSLGYELVWITPPDDESSGAEGRVARLSRRIYRQFRVPVLDRVEAYLCDRSVVEVFRSLPHRDEDVRLTLALFGFRQTTIVAPSASTELPTPPMTDVFFRVASRLLEYSVVPVRIISGLGALLGVGALVYAATIVVRATLFELGDLGWPSLALTALFVGAAQLMSLGIIVEYLWRIFQQTRQAPRYIIKEQLGVPLRRPEQAWAIDPNNLDVSLSARQFMPAVRAAAAASSAAAPPQQATSSDR